MAIKLWWIWNLEDFFSQIEWSWPYIFVEVDKNPCTKGQMASQSKSEMTGLCPPPQVTLPALCGGRYGAVGLSL